MGWFILSSLSRHPLLDFFYTEFGEGWVIGEWSFSIQLEMEFDDKTLNQTIKTNSCSVSFLQVI